MESPPKSARRVRPGQVDVHIYIYLYTYVYARRETAVKARASNGKETVTIKIPGNEDTRRDDLLRASPSPRDPAARERYHTALPRFILHIELSIECYKFCS